ncbi:MAG: GatB/YqeY domain-containing protein [Pseudomonadota bacterium]|nr:GatB/YqeY domain-containing protein [Pseudomonadota bacterium]MDO7667939.1 GatB/YqeY domain-containing protein [Pseudomonadota bacterium]MDO7710293.1 GatB/YqeY domain-containing protein [Pseudomonadota bacterium]
MPAESSPLKLTITDNVKDAMRAKEKERLATLRQITAAIKQFEVDNRKDLDDEGIITILTKMCKQRRDSLSQFQAAGRDDLAAIEIAELAIIEEFMPTAMTEQEIADAIQAAITESSAASARDMGAVMNILRPKLQGRADMGAVSGLVKAALSA